MQHRERKLKLRKVLPKQKLMEQRKLQQLLPRRLQTARLKRCSKRPKIRNSKPRLRLPTKKSSKPR